MNTWIVVSLFILLIQAGCKSPISVKGDDIKSIKLECTRLCLDSMGEPFTTRQFVDSDSIRLFSSAINQAKKIKGMLDYDATFAMTIMMKDGGVNQYHLGLTNTTRTHKGLLLKLPDTARGYLIPVKTSSKLQDLIYNSKL